MHSQYNNRWKSHVQINSTRIKVDHQLCIFHAIYNNKNDAKNECKSLSKSTLDKMTIFNHISQINEIVRQLSLKDAEEQINELKQIEKTIGLPSINKKNA